MRVSSEKILDRCVWSTPAAMRRAGCVALVVCVCACGGGNDGVPLSNSAPDPTPSTPAPGATRPPLVPAPSIDSAASGNPVSVRVALSANGDGFAVWQAHDGTRHNLWANRYRAAAAAWGSAANIEASSTDIDDFDLAVDGSGNAVVAWHEAPPGNPPPGRGEVKSTRFDAQAHAWAMPVLLNANASEPRVAGNAGGTMLAVYVFDTHLVRGRFFDPAVGTWQPEAAIEQNTTGTGASFSPVSMVDGRGNALALWRGTRTGVEVVGSNYFSRDAGGWPQLPPGETGILGGIPGSFIQGSLGNLQLAAGTDGNFLAVWAAIQGTYPPESAETAILAARFTSSTGAWSAVRTVVPNSTQGLELQRVGSGADGKVLVLWTEAVGLRRALKAVRVDDVGATCSAAQVIDSAVGGGAARADLGIDPQGRAVAIWQQFEGGRADDGSRSNVAISRFDGTWGGAAFAETQPGNAISPHASASGGQALLGWIQPEDGDNHVKALLHAL